MEIFKLTCTLEHLTDSSTKTETVEVYLDFTPKELAIGGFVRIKTALLARRITAALQRPIARALNKHEFARLDQLRKWRMRGATYWWE